MNRMTRRVVIGTLATGAVAAVIPVTSAQPKKRESKQLAGFKRQIKMGFDAMNGGNPVGALLIANAFYSWADHLEDNDIDNTAKQLVRKNRSNRGTVNHKEMELLAKELGVDTIISVHTEPKPFDIQKAYDDIVNGDTISKRMRDAANIIAASAQRWPNAANIKPIQWPYFGNPLECPVCVYAAEYQQNAQTLCEYLAVSYFFGPAAFEAASLACASAMAMAMALQTSCLMAQVFGCS